jgi:hypothetical protein
MNRTHAGGRFTTAAEHASSKDRPVGASDVPQVTAHPSRLLSRFVRRVAPVILVAAFVAACSSGAAANGVATLQSPGTSAAASPSPTPASKEDAFLAFAKCMRDHGIDMPDPQMDPNGGGGFMVQGTANGDNGAFEAADKACSHFLDDIAKGAPKEMSAEEQQKFLDYAKCMRDHGVDMPDPDFSQGGVSMRIGSRDGGINPDSPTFKSAQDACQTILGNMAPGSGSTSITRGQAGTGPSVQSAPETVP